VVAEQTMGVRFEPCPWYADGDDDSAAACCHCGWLEDDHREEKLPGGAAGWAGYPERLAS
jgi:hypothetical protein